MTRRYLFEVIQAGIVVAEGDCADRETAIREAAHYVAQYSQDGECQAFVRRHRRPNGIGRKKARTSPLKTA